MEPKSNPAAGAMLAAAACHVLRMQGSGLRPGETIETRAARIADALKTLSSVVRAAMEHDALVAETVAAYVRASDAEENDGGAEAKPMVNGSRLRRDGDLFRN